MIQIRDEHAGDFAAREQLLDACFGESRRMKTSERLREGRLPAEGLALVAECDGRIVGTVRSWHVAWHVAWHVGRNPEAGHDRSALLLGPLAVDPSIQGLGLGARLMRASLRRAEDCGHGAVLLVGDAPYYERFGFTQNLVDGLFMPGPFERARFLGLELRRGALRGATGVLRATGDWMQTDTAVAEPALAEAGAVARRRVA